MFTCSYVALQPLVKNGWGFWATPLFSMSFVERVTKDDDRVAQAV